MSSSIFLAGLMGLLTMQLTSPTDISGHWTGENWQHVSLASVDEASDWYSGTFVDATGRRGALRLEWSRLQRRYNGRWKLGDTENWSDYLAIRRKRNAARCCLRGPGVAARTNVPRLLEFAWKPASEQAQQNFELQTAEYRKIRQESDRQMPGQTFSIKSPIPGIIVHVADGVKLDVRVKQGDLSQRLSQQNPLPWQNNSNGLRFAAAVGSYQLQDFGLRERA